MNLNDESSRLHFRHRLITYMMATKKDFIIMPLLFLLVMTIALALGLIYGSIELYFLPIACIATILGLALLEILRIVSLLLTRVISRYVNHITIKKFLSLLIFILSFILQLLLLIFINIYAFYITIGAPH